MKKIKANEAIKYIFAQIVGAFLAVIIVNTMYGKELIELSSNVRSGNNIYVSEILATFGLVLIILLNLKERKEIIEGFKYVNQVIPFDDSDDTASDLIRRVHSIYDGEEFEHNYTDDEHMGMVDYYQIYFANGGDRGKGNVPELDVCKELGVTMLWGVGGGKIQSSSWLINGGKDE